MALTLNHAKSPETTITHGADALVREFLAGGTLVAGDVMAFDTSQTGEDQTKYVVQGGLNGYAVGVALEAATSGGVVRVLVGGYCEGVNASGGGTIGAGDSLTAIASGAVDVYAAAAVDPVLAVALDDESGSAVTLYWFPTVI